MENRIATVTISDLYLQTIVGTHGSERENKQNIIATITLEYNASDAIKTDNLSGAIDYNTISDNVISRIEASNFFLIETLANAILKIVTEDPKIINATVTVSKPNALKRAHCVSTTVSSNKK